MVLETDIVCLAVCMCVCRCQVLLNNKTSIFTLHYIEVILKLLVAVLACARTDVTQHQHMTTVQMFLLLAQVRSFRCLCFKSGLSEGMQHL